MLPNADTSRSTFSSRFIDGILQQQFFSNLNLKKKLAATVVLCLASIVATLSLLLYSSFKYNSNLCTDHGCILSAVRLLEGMNMSADPCDDFYEYMCGNWPTQHANPVDEANSWFMERSKVTNNRMKTLLEASNDDEDIPPIQKMKKFYKLCTNTTNLNGKGLKPIFRILDKLGLPRLPPTADTAEDVNLAQVLSHAQRLLNFDILIQLSTRYSSTLSTTVLSVGPASNDVSFISKRKTLTNSRYKSRITPEEYLLHQISYMTAVMDEISEGALQLDDISRAAFKIVFVEAQLKLTVEETSAEEEKYMTFNDLQNFMFTNYSTRTNGSTFSWQDYIVVLTNKLNVSLDMNSVVHVTRPIYFQNLANHFVNMKPINFQRFIWWKVVHAVATHTTDSMRRHEYMFNQYILHGITQLPTRSAKCVDLTKTLFNEAMSFKFASQNINNMTKKVSNIMSSIKEVFKQIIMNSEWIDEATKNVTIHKVNSIKTYIGYPPHLFDTKWIVQRYKKVKLFEDEFLETLLGMRASLIDDVLVTIYISGRDNDFENDSWSADFTEVNAYYSRERNSIVIPSGILQYPFYVDGIEALNYGAIGSILGHELTHGFDSEGKNYDWNGDKKATWSGPMISAYDERSRCFIDQYSQYNILPNVTVNGNTTLAENIADNGGIKEAFYAYKRYVRENGAEKLLPGFEHFTHNQLLFMSFANVWCKQQNEVSRKFSVLDEHSPNNYRVIGSLSNLVEFSNTWNCDKNKKMNSINKCVLW